MGPTHTLMEGERKQTSKQRHRILAKYYVDNKRVMGSRGTGCWFSCMVREGFPNDIWYNSMIRRSHTHNNLIRNLLNKGNGLSLSLRLRLGQAQYGQRTERRPVQRREMGKKEEESERKAKTGPGLTERIWVSLQLLCLPNLCPKKINSSGHVI